MPTFKIHRIWGVIKANQTLLDTLSGRNLLMFFINDVSSRLLFVFFIFNVFLFPSVLLFFMISKISFFVISQVVILQSRLIHLISLAIHRLCIISLSPLDLLIVFKLFHLNKPINKINYLRSIFYSYFIQNNTFSINYYSYSAEEWLVPWSHLPSESTSMWVCLQITGNV